MSQLLNVQIDFLASIALFQRIFEVFDHYGKPNRRVREKRIVEFTKGSIAVRNLSFTYDAQCWGIKDACFDINQGEIVALVGPSGAGKTTLAYLLAALYEPTLGSISIDGYNVLDLDEKSLRRCVALVTEDNCLLDATIRDNLLLGNELAREDEILKACKAVGIHDYITSLSKGYESWLHQGGAQLSAGQKRRVMLARAMIKNPLILILDEVTSSLDPMAQDSINNVIKALFAQRSGLIIGHHLPTILLADRILVIENGRIVQQGVHEKLVREGGLYARLFSSYPYNGRDNSMEIVLQNSRVNTADHKEYIQER
ncbi:MAG: ABC transporter ATP-binding protein [Candidatus Tectomicrobia bacterium]|nr:ABC transporter ATP-binding protein [Candidatus Tectomicrobia bacterium]